MFDGKVENPGWTADGTGLLLQKGKQRSQVPVAGGKVEPASESQAGKSGRQAERVSPDQQRTASLSSWSQKPRETTLQITNLNDGKIKVLAKLLGGRGTLGESPWSPDGKRLVFVSYQIVPHE